LYATKVLNLPTDPEEQAIDIAGRVSYFTIKLTRVAQVNLSQVEHYYEKKVSAIEQSVITVYDLVLRFVMQKFYTAYQGNFYDLDKRQHSAKIPLFDFVPGF